MSVYHPHSSWHRHYQIRHSNLVQRIQSQADALQKIHNHLPQPDESFGKMKKLKFKHQHRHAQTYPHKDMPIRKEERDDYDENATFDMIDNLLGFSSK